MLLLLLRHRALCQRNGTFCTTTIVRKKRGGKWRHFLWPSLAVTWLTSLAVTWMTLLPVRATFGSTSLQHLLKCGFVRPDILLTTLCDKVCQWLATGRWFSPGTPVSSTNKTDRYNITEILLKVALSTINSSNQLIILEQSEQWESK